MVTASADNLANTQQDIAYLKRVVCGNGRIGAKVKQGLQKKGVSYEESRILPTRGLEIVKDEQSLIIEKLLVVIAPPKHSQTWQWDQIFLGLVKQIKRQQLTIRQCIFVSSTRVYDGYQSGVISASDRVKPHSERAIQLRQAEQMLSEASDSLVVFRCAGLYGDDYMRYWPILQAALDKPRFGCRVNVVVDRLIALMLEEHVAAKLTIYLMTDGMIYFKGQQLADHHAAHLAAQYRLLKDSVYQVK